MTLQIWIDGVMALEQYFGGGDVDINADVLKRRYYYAIKRKPWHIIQVGVQSRMNDPNFFGRADEHTAKFDELFPTRKISIR